MGLRADESEQEDQSRSAQQKTSSESTAMPDSSSGSEGKSGNSEPVASPLLWSISTTTDGRGHIQFFTRRLLDELGLWPARSSGNMTALWWRQRMMQRQLDHDVSMVQQMERSFAVMDRISRSVGFLTAQVPGEKTTDHRTTR